MPARFFGDGWGGRASLQPILGALNQTGFGVGFCGDILCAYCRAGVDIVHLLLTCESLGIKQSDPALPVLY